MRLLLERLKRVLTAIQDGQEGLSWKVTSSCLKEKKEPVLCGERKEACKAEEIYGGPEGAKELGVTEELVGQGGQNTSVRGEDLG